MCQKSDSGFKTGTFRGRGRPRSAVVTILTHTRLAEGRIPSVQNPANMVYSLFRLFEDVTRFNLSIIRENPMNFSDIGVKPDLVVALAKQKITEPTPIPVSYTHLTLPTKRIV